MAGSSFQEFGANKSGNYHIRHFHTNFIFTCDQPFSVVQPKLGRMSDRGFLSKWRLQEGIRRIYRTETDILKALSTVYFIALDGAFSCPNARFLAISRSLIRPDACCSGREFKAVV